MPRLSNSVPKLRLHKSSGHARVQLGRREFWLGPYGSEESRHKYNELVGQWLAAGRPTHWQSNEELAKAKPDPPIIVSEIVIRYAEMIHRRWPAVDGKKSSQVVSRTSILKRFRKHYGAYIAQDFGPLALQEYRRLLVELGHSRKYVNMQIDQIKRMFKWSVSNEIYPAEKLQALMTVEGLRKGESGVSEPEPVRPVPDEIVRATLAKLPQVVADMVRVQQLTGMRPGEVCQIKPSDIECASEVWVFRPESHKSQGKGKHRLVAIGPKAQEVLRPYLDRDKDAFCFSPKEVVDALMSERKANAATHKKYRRVKRPQRKPGDCYKTQSYRRAIHRACKAAGVETWGPHRLRHAAATKVRAEYGLEAAQVVLGHSNAKTSEIYAEMNFESAAKVMKEIG